jgi:hypothetical protein
MFFLDLQGIIHIPYSIITLYTKRVHVYKARMNTYWDIPFSFFFLLFYARWLRLCYKRKRSLNVVFWVGPPLSTYVSNPPFYTCTLPRPLPQHIFSHSGYFPTPHPPFLFFSLIYFCSSPSTLLSSIYLIILLCAG